MKREPSFNTYPICLTKGTLIDAPGRPVPVEHLQKGMVVLTVGESGNRIAAAVLETTMTPVPSSSQVIRLGLNDGRTITVSPGHPTAEGKAIGNYNVGDILDGALLITVEYINYNGGTTYDLFPDGSTGLYWANGVLLKSTLVIK